MARAVKVVVFCGAILVMPPFAEAQRSRCADCHYADPAAPRRDHLNEWDRSLHGRNNVGCEKCHAGDAGASEKFIAHRGVQRAGDTASPVNRQNLPATCGRCHTGPSLAFENSRHYQLLRTGSRKGPTCSTCHGEVDGRVLSPKALASQCGDCHGPGEAAPRAERARLAREHYEGLTAVREQVKLARSLIKRIDEPGRRAELNEALDQVQVAVTLAVDAGHKFVYDNLKEDLARAQKRIEPILAKLVNR
jgi:hypothetical protein